MKAFLGKVVVFLPAYFAEKTLAAVHAKIPKECVDDMVLVDDGSKDGIEAVAKRLGLRFFRNPRNLGYGGNLKVCLEKATQLDASILVELHPDDQYDPAAIRPALQKMAGGCDMVLGSRFIVPGALRRDRMPLWKYCINRLSTLAARAVLGTSLTDFHSGFRVYRREMVQRLAYERNADDYLFSFQVIAQARFAGFRIEEIPVACRYAPGVTQIGFAQSMRYGLGAAKTLCSYALAKLGFRQALFMEKSCASAAAASASTNA